MNRAQLEHILRAAGAIAGVTDLVVIGSQAVLACPGELPPALLVSMEADLYPRNQPQLAVVIEGSIGELSPFHETFGYFAHGVGPETAFVVQGWQERLLLYRNENTGGVTGWCLHPLDLAIAKLAAARPKDLDYVKILLQAKLVDRTQLEDLLRQAGLEALSQRLKRLLLERPGC